MIKSLEDISYEIAVKIKNVDLNNDKTASLEILTYGLIISLNFILITLSSLLIGTITGKFVETLSTIGYMIVLRYVSGGYHLKSSWGCVFFSIAAILLISHIGFVLEGIIHIITFVSAIILLILSPILEEEHTLIPKKFFPILKFFSLLIALSNFIFLDFVFAMALVIQSISLILGRLVK